MNRYTPDSWIESPANGMICDDAGHCPECGEHLDGGRCECEYEDLSSGLTAVQPLAVKARPIADAAQNNFLSVDCASVLRDQALTSHAPKDAAQESFSEKQ